MAPPALLLQSLLAIAALAQAAAAGPTQMPSAAPAPARHLAAAAVPLFPNRSSIVVCTGERVPMTMCEGLTPADYSGFEIDVFRAAMPALGWTDAMLRWRCIDRVELRSWLHEAGNGSVDGSGSGGAVAPEAAACDLLVAGLPISTAEMARGVAYTYPNSQDAYGILIRAPPRPDETWRFLDAFSWQVWLAIVVTAVVVGCVVWGLDTATYMGAHRADAKKWPATPLAPSSTVTWTLNERIWEGLAKPLGYQVPYAKSWGGRTVWLVYSFVILVLVTLYTSITAATITAARLEPPIQAPDDLVGQSIGVSEFFNGTLPQGVVQVRLDGDASLLEALRAGAVAAVVMPFSFILYYARTNCDLVIAGAPFDRFDRAVALPPGSPNPAFVAAYNAALTEIRGKGIDRELFKRYWPAPPSDSCPAHSPSHSGEIAFEQIAGLWVLYAFGMVVAYSLVAWPHLAAWRSRRRHAAAVAARSSGGSGKGDILPVSVAAQQQASQPPPPPPPPASVPSAPAAAAEEERLHTLLQAQQCIADELSSMLQQRQQRQQRQQAKPATPRAPSNRITMTTLLVLLLPFAAAAGAPAAGSALAPESLPTLDIPFFPNRTTVTVCTAQHTPFAFCEGRVPGNYSGYAVRAFKAIQPALGWTEPMLSWRCMGWQEMMDDLSGPNGTCDIAVTDVPVDMAAQQAGLALTWPILRGNSMGLLQLVQARSFSIWSFLGAFSWQLWLALWLTSAVTGLVVWSLDVLNAWGAKCRSAAAASPPLPRPPVLSPEQYALERVLAGHYTYASLGRFMRVCIWKVRSDPGRIVVWCFSFLMLTLAVLFMANTTANLTAFTLKLDGGDLGALSRVGTWEAYRGQLPALAGKQVTYFPWDGAAADEAAMLDALKSGQVQALYMPRTFTDYVASFDCSLVVAEHEAFAAFWGAGVVTLADAPLFDQAFAFPAGFSNSALMDTVNLALQSLKETDLLSRVAQQQLAASHAWQCNLHSLPKASTQLGFSHVRGLWGLLGMAVAAGAVLAAMPHLSYAAGRAWQERRQAAPLPPNPSKLGGRRRWLPHLGGLLRRSRSVRDEGSSPDPSNGRGNMAGAKLSWYGFNSSPKNSTDCLKGAGSSSSSSSGDAAVDVEAPPPAVEQLPAPQSEQLSSLAGGGNDSNHVAALLQAQYVAAASARSLRALLQPGPQ